MGRAGLLNVALFLKAPQDGFGLVPAVGGEKRQCPFLVEIRILDLPQELSGCRCGQACNDVSFCNPHGSVTDRLVLSRLSGPSRRIATIPAP